MKNFRSNNMRKIDSEVRSENLEEDVKALYRILRPDVAVTDIEYYEFNEGIVNSIVRLDDAKTNDPIVFRTYAIKIKKFQTSSHQSKSFKFINRELELATLERASELGITVELIATYSNGFIYKYIDGDVNSVETYDVETAKKVAQKLARFHDIKLDALARDRPLVDTYSNIKEDPNLTEKEKFNERMKESDYDEFTSRLPLYMALQKEYEKLNSLILERNGYGKVCLCHNDLTLTNILIERATKEPFLIDFEMVSVPNLSFDDFDE